MSYAEHFRENAIKQFEYYKILSERSFDQVNDEQFFWQYNDESNSIAITAKHMAGNMLSRWTDFLTTDGEKIWRNRDMEFELENESRQDIMEHWKKGWNCLFAAMNEISEQNFDKQLLIRNTPHSITEAVNRQVGHMAYHTGQIAYIGRMIKGKEWQSLSIPKGKSVEFNQQSFAKEKRQEHFTDEWRK